MKKLVKVVGTAVLVSMLAAPAMAATEWNFGATLQYKTFWTERDWGKVGGEDIEGGGKRLGNDGYLDWTTQGDSNIRMYMRSDYLEGYIELEYDTDKNKIKTKQYWGQYNFNENFSILIGQTDPLFMQEISNQVAYDNANLNSIGTANADTLPMIALSCKGFTFALAQPKQNSKNMLDMNKAFYNMFAGPSLAGVTYDRDTFMPQLHASYAYEADEWRIKFAGAFASTRYKNIMDGTVDLGSKTVNSWIAGMDGKIFFGPLSLGAAISYGANWELAGWNESEYALAYPLFKPNASGNSIKIKDTYTLMASLVGAYQLTEALGFEAGVGYRRDDNDMFDKANSTWTAYLQAVYEVADGFTLTPEIGYINYGDNTGGKWGGSAVKGNQDQGYEWYAGMQWRMDF